MRIRFHSARAARSLLATVVATLLLAGPALAEPVQAAFALTDVDWTSAGVCGIGGACSLGGSGTIALAGVNGPVTRAFVYWHGIDSYGAFCASPPASQSAPSSFGSRGAPAGGNQIHGCDGVYDRSVIIFNGVPVTGVALGDATTNCWGSGSSRAFRADVTGLVAGNGVYTLDGMSDGQCDDANGASLIVTFDDGDPNNNRDLVFFEGNDSNVSDGFPGETDGWHAVLDGITYSGAGTAYAQLHLADGQTFDPAGLDDNTLTFSAGGPPLTVPDAMGRYDGTSLPNAGNSRSDRGGTVGGLWDIHTVDLSPLFGAAGNYTLTMDGQDPYYDCLGLALLIMDLEAGSAPVPVKHRSWGSLKAHYR